MKNTYSLVIVIFALLLAGCAGSKDEVKTFDRFTIQRGTNIAHWLSQSDRRGDEREAFFTQEDMDRIASLGFDHVRIPIDEEQMWDEDMNKMTGAFELLHSAIGWASDAGLRVIVDLHILRSHHFNAGERPLWTDPDEQVRFLDLWRDLSDELESYPVGQVAYELMNEAVTDDPSQWNDLIMRAFHVIRENEPLRTIVIGSNMWQSPETFTDLVIPENDTNILLSFHFYTPFALTHHQAEWTAIYAYDGPVDYPGQVVREADLEGYSEEIISEMEWASGYFTLDTLEKAMQIPIEYAAGRGLPLYCGEFGVYKPAPRDAALRWYDDMITVLETHDIAWANWCYKGSFGIFREDGEVDTELMGIFFKHMN